MWECFVDGKNLTSSPPPSSPRSKHGLENQGLGQVEVLHVVLIEIKRVSGREGSPKRERGSGSAEKRGRGSHLLDQRPFYRQFPIAIRER
jgi:hypothetical protein